MAIQRTCLVVMGIILRMISSDVNAAITPTVGVGYTLLPGRGRYVLSCGGTNTEFLDGF